jgi:hypothetical protein
VPLTCAHWLSVLEPRLIRPLFESESVERFRSLSRALPGECQGVLEARLAAGADLVDLSLRLLTAAQAREVAERFPPSPVRDFLSGWLEPVRSVWLEFDLDQPLPADQVPDPVVCAKLPKGVDPGWLTGTLLPALNGQPPSAKQRDVIFSCLEALPASASLLYVFNLRSRGTDAVRLEIFGMEPAHILGYLQSVAPRSVSAVTEVIPLFEGVERLHLSLDVTSEISPRIGIEGSYPRQPQREPRWEDLFARLVEKRLCSPGKRDAALAWPGYDTFWTASGRWPVAEAGIRGFCVRTLSHLKVVCRPGREPEAKVYLTFGPLDRPTPKAAASSPASRSVFST